MEFKIARAGLGMTANTVKQYRRRGLLPMRSVQVWLMVISEDVFMKLLWVAV
jgi:hypothetical protein